MLRKVVCAAVLVLACCGLSSGKAAKPVVKCAISNIGSGQTVTNPIWVSGVSTTPNWGVSIGIDWQGQTFDANFVATDANGDWGGTLTAPAGNGYSIWANVSQKGSSSTDVKINITVK